MAENAVVRSRINNEVKMQAAVVLQSMGLSVSDVMRIVLTHIAREGTLPFELTPNKLTRQALEKSARGEEVHCAKDVQDLFNKLEI